MQKWRPLVEQDNLYVIPDIHGQHKCLSHLLNKILPLRKSDGRKDRIVFLGDYIDRHIDSHQVLDLLIQVKEQFPKQVVFLKGNHEQMLLQALGYEETMFAKDMFDCWLSNGGHDTIIGYLHRNKVYDVLSHNVTIKKLKELIPQEHIEFMMSCQDYYWHEKEFFFVHGGFNPFLALEDHNKEVFYWDRSLVKYVQNAMKNKEEVGWDYTVICGHSGPNPIIHPKYLMLDAGSPRRLLMSEINTRTAVILEPDKSRVVNFDLTPQMIELKKPSFSRVDLSKKE